MKARGTRGPIGAQTDRRRGNLSRGITGARMKRALVYLVVTASALAGVSEAQAAGPILLSVGHVQRHPEATWSLPPGGDAWTLEIATHPETGTDGSFFEENRVVFEVLSRTQTHFLGTERLDRGTYYVHVSSSNSSCEPTCVEWSQVLELLIERPPPLPRATRRRCGQLTPAPSPTVLATGHTSATPFASLFETRQLRRTKDAVTRSATRAIGGSPAQTAR
jgi:hypothetical protein